MTRRWLTEAARIDTSAVALRPEPAEGCDVLDHLRVPEGAVFDPGPGWGVVLCERCGEPRLVRVRS